MARPHRAFIDAMRSVDPDASRDFPGGVVLDVQPDGTLNVDLLGEVHFGIPALSSYRNRQKDDIVLLRLAKNQMVVVDKIGDADEGLRSSWGYGAPVDSGWVQGSSVWARGEEVYIQRPGSDPAPPDVDDPGSTNPVAQTPIVPDSDQGYRNGSRDDYQGGVPAQSQFGSSSYGPWRGGWFYGSALVTAMNAKPVKSAQLRLDRENSSHGQWGKVRVSVYAHNSLTPPRGQLNFVGGPWRGPSLSLGASEWWSIPREAINLLRANTAKGFGVYATDPDEYVIFEAGCGQVKIYN